jgi:hypothetical protein
LTWELCGTCNCCSLCPHCADDNKESTSLGRAKCSGLKGDSVGNVREEHVAADETTGEELGSSCRFSEVDGAESKGDRVTRVYRRENALWSTSASKSLKLQEYVRITLLLQHHSAVSALTLR